ncbi:MAG: alanine--tRNA ligase, partial [Solobacterium sp.]|nr:alanine--tRNA ligase [Solobacterium sp.]
VLPGEVVFRLYDTYGFPKELTAEIAEDAGYQVDMEGFDREMAAQVKRAKDARGNEQSMHGQSADLMDFEEESEFTGYTDLVSTGKVIGLFKDGVRVKELTDSGDVILSRTCFYAESGGQCADTGILQGQGFKADVTDVKKAPHRQPLHHIEIKNGTLKEGDEVTGAYNYENRQRTRANHSSLHLLQSALRTVLGDHVAQAGSYNCPEYGRFDFNHYEKVSDEQLKEIERLVNTMIQADVDVTTEVLPIEEAKKTGAIALFDEKYGDSVRVVTMGEYSKEFCGGTHVSNTGNLGVFKIISEESIGSGVRRITSITKMDAYNAFKTEEDYLLKTASLMKLKNYQGLQEKIAGLLEENAALKKEIAESKQKAMAANAGEQASKAEAINGLNVLILSANGMDTGAMKGYAETLRNKLTDGLVFVSNANEGKVTFVCAASKAAIDKGLKAGDLVKAAAQLCGGNGGGRPDMAQAGGKDVTAVDKALAEVKNRIQNA